MNTCDLEDCTVKTGIKRFVRFGVVIHEGHPMVYERVSLDDGSLVTSYAENIQRYEFALNIAEGRMC